MSTPRERPGTTTSVGSHATTHTEHSTRTGTEAGGGQEQGHASHGNTARQADMFSRRCVLHTGPEGLRPHRVTVASSEYQYVGENALSPEVSGSLDYLFRGPRDVPFPKAKNGRIGETGWEMENIKGFNLMGQ